MTTPVGKPFTMEESPAKWKLVVTGYDTSVPAQGIDNEGSPTMVPGKRYAVTTFDATNEGQTPLELTTYLIVEYAVDGVTTGQSDECSFFTNDAYPWTDAIEEFYAKVLPGATGHMAICRLVRDEDVNDVQLVVETKGLSDAPKAAVAAVR
jgi:hypothetical protein